MPGGFQTYEVSLYGALNAPGKVEAEESVDGGGPESEEKETTVKQKEKSNP